MKPGMDIEIIGTVAFVRVFTGNMPAAKALQHAQSYAEFFTWEIKKAMEITHCLFIPYSKDMIVPE